jgi:hypothetical protein
VAARPNREAGKRVKIGCGKFLNAPGAVKDPASRPYNKLEGDETIMFGLKKLRARISMLEVESLVDRADPEQPTITIPVVNSLGEPVSERTVLFCYPFMEPKTHTLTLQEAFDKLQEALGVQLTLEQGTTDSVKVYGE